VLTVEARKKFLVPLRVREAEPVMRTWMKLWNPVAYAIGGLLRFVICEVYPKLVHGPVQEASE
jgi:hypothetical protein